ncbi:hypothetical protein [Actinospica robiniae]|uniref:hypothetical protein n=1 Tax=Actinospica robiniae TaxID=304901 RepID=UPI00042007B1|nr:hypothetical protein [Actinospica robiniae]
MAVGLYGRDVDVFFQGIVVEYDEAGCSTRVVVNQAGPVVAGLPVPLLLETTYSECLRVLDEQGLEYVEEEAEIRLPTMGMSLLTARSGHPDLPIAAVVVGPAA